MRNLVWAVCFTLVCFWAVPVFAADNTPYLRAQVGGTWVNDSDAEGVDIQYDGGFNIGAALGYDFGLARLEGEFGYRQNDIDELEALGVSVGADGDVSLITVMGNGYIDFENQTPFIPYIMGGVGIGFISANDVEVMDIEVVDDDDTVFAYQLGAGFGYEVVEGIYFDVSYRFLGTSDPEFEDVTDVEFESEYQSHNIVAGVKFSL